MKTLCVMVKAPMMGRVKTRLARDIGAAAAVAAYRTMLGQSLRRLGADPRWRVVLAVAPDAAVDARAFPAGLARIAQGRGDLGDRMRHVMNVLRPSGLVLVVGSDIPGIAPRHVAAAFAKLEGHDAVIGPAPDGGYWAIGLGRRRRLSPFSHVRWSTPYALEDTVTNLKGVRIAMAPELADVDSSDEWRAWTRRPASIRLRGC